MASNRVSFPINTPWGSQVAEFASLIARSQALGARVMDAMNSMAAGGAGPFDALEAELNMEAGNGILLYQVINVANQQVAEVDVSRIDQGS